MVKSARHCPISFYGTGSANTAYTSGLGFSVDDFATESGVYVLSREAGTYSNMRFDVYGNTMGDTTITLRHQLANGNLTISITGYSTGTFEDTTHTDVFADNQALSYRIDKPATTGNIYGFLRTHFEPDDTTKTITQYGYSYDDWPVGTSAANTTYYFPLTGSAYYNNTTESYVRTTFKEALTIRNFQVCISENYRTSTTTTFRVRKNGADGNSVISVSAGVTGIHEDSTHTDSIAVDDYVNLSLTTGNETTKIAATHQSVYIEASPSTPIIPLHCGSGQSASGGEPFAYSSGDFFTFFGDLTNIWSSTELTGGTNLGLVGTVKRLFVRSGANTCNGSSIVELRQNFSPSGLTISIGASTTGDFWDLTNITELAVDDELCYHIQTSGTSGTLYLGVINSSLELPFVSENENVSGMKVAHVSVMASTGVGNQDITFDSPAAFTPKAAIFQYSRAAVGAGFNEGTSIGYGITDGTNSRSIAYVSEDAVASSDTATVCHNSSVIVMLNQTGTITTIDGLASFVQWLSNGVRINWSNAPTAGCSIAVTFLGGDIITNATVGTLQTTTGTSPVSVTSLTYQPDFGIFLCTGNISEGAGSSSNPWLSFGAAISSSAQWCQSLYHVDASGSSASKQNYSHSRVLVAHTTTLTGYATFTSFNSNGFTITPTDAFPTSYYMYYLVLKGGQYSVGNATEPASTGTQTITTNTDVRGVMVLGNDIGTADTVSNGNTWTSGAGIDSTYTTGHAIDELYASDPTANVTYHSTTRIYNNITANATASSSTIDDQAYIYSVSGTGFTLWWTNIGQARPFRYITFGGKGYVVKAVTIPKFDIRQEVTKTNTVPRFDIEQEVVENPVMTQVVRFQKDTSGTPNATQDIALNFTPKAIIVYSDGSSTDNSAASHYQWIQGISDGTNHASVCIASDDADLAADTATYYSNNSVFVRLSDTANETVLSRATCSFSTNKVTFTWVVNNTAATYVHMMAFGGDDITNAKVNTVNNGTGGATGNVDYTGLNFNPSDGNAVLFTLSGYANNASLNAANTYASLNWGCAVSSSKRWTLYNVMEDIVDPSETWRYYSNTQCLALGQNTTGSVYGTADFVSWITDGFRLNWTAAPASTMMISYLVINGGTWDCGSLQAPTTPTNDVDTAVSVNSQPIRGLLISTVGLTTSDTPTAYAILGVGATDGTTQSCIGTIDEDGQTTTDSYRINKTTSIVSPLGTDGALYNDAVFDSFGTNNFRLDWTVTGTARYHGWVVVADGQAVTSVTKSVTFPKFDIIQQITDINTLKSDIREALTDTNTLRYDIRIPLTDTNTLQYYIREETTDTNNLKWDIRYATVKTNTLLVNILKELTDTNTLQYDIIAEITKPNSFLFDIVSTVPVTRQISLLYQVIYQPVKTASLRHSIVQEVPVKTTTLIQNITLLAEKTLTVLQDIQYSPVKPLTLLFGLTQTALKTETLLQSLEQSAIKTETLRHNITAETIKTLDALFDIQVTSEPFVFTKRNTDSDISTYRDLTIDTDVDTTINVNIPARTTVFVRFVTTSGLFSKLDWENGTYTCRLRITSAAANTQLSYVQLQRMSDAGSIKTYKTGPTIDQSITTNGVYSPTVDWNDGSQNPINKALDDRLEVTFALYNTHNSQTRTVGIGTNLSNNNDEITTPIQHFYALTVEKPVFMKYSIAMEMPTPKATTLLADIRHAQTKIENLLFHIRLKAEQDLVARFDVIGEAIKQLTTKYDIREVMETPRALTLIFAVKEKAEQIRTILFDARQELTPVKTLTLLQKITEDVTLLNNLIFDVRSELTKTETLLHDIRKDTVKSEVLRFSIIQSLIDITSILFNIEIEFVGQVEKTSILRFHITQQVLKSLTTIYDELQEITDSLTLRYDVRKDTTKQAVLLQDIRQDVRKTRTLLQNITIDVTKSETIRFNVTLLVANTLTLVQNILNAITKTGTQKFNIQSEIAKLNNIIFNIEEIGAVIKTLRILTNIRQPIEESNTLRFNIEELVQKTNTLLYDIFKSAIKQGVFKYGIIKETTDTNTIRFNITTTVEKQKTLVFNVLQKIIEQNTTIFNIVKQVPAVSRSLKYDVISETVKAERLLYNIREFIDKSVTIDQQIYQKAEQDATVRYDVIAQVGKYLTIIQNIVNTLEKQNSLLYRITEEVPELSLETRFDIISQTTKMLRALYDVRQFHQSSKTLVFNILPKGVTPKVTLHEQLLDWILTHWNISNPSYDKVLWHEWYNGQADICIDSLMYNHFTLERNSTQIYKERNYSTSIHIFYRDYSDTNPDDRNIPKEMANVINEVQRILLTSRYAMYNEFLENGINVYEMKIRDAKFVPDPSISEGSSTKILHYRFIVEMLYQKLIF